MIVVSVVRDGACRGSEAVLRISGLGVTTGASIIYGLMRLSSPSQLHLGADGWQAQPCPRLPIRFHWDGETLRLTLDGAPLDPESYRLSLWVDDRPQTPINFSWPENHEFDPWAPPTSVETKGKRHPEPPLPQHHYGRMAFHVMLVLFVVIGVAAWRLNGRPSDPVQPSPETPKPVVSKVAEPSPPQQQPQPMLPPQPVLARPSQPTEPERTRRSSPPPRPSPAAEVEAPPPAPAALGPLPVPELRRRKFAPQELRCDISSAHLTDKDLSRCDLAGADLRGMAMDGVNLTGANLTEVDLTGASLRGAILDGAHGEKVVFENANLGPRDDSGVATSARKCRFVASNFRGARLTKIGFYDCTLRQSDFSSAIISGGSFDSARAEGARFMGAMLRDIGWREAHLDGADFQGARGLGQPPFPYAYFSKALNVPGGVSTAEESGEPPLETIINVLKTVVR